MHKVPHRPFWIAWLAGLICAACGGIDDDDPTAISESAVTAAPTGLSPATAVFPRVTTQVTLSWSPVAGANRYAVRANDETQPNLRDPRNDCLNSPHYLCVNHVSGTSISLPVIAGHTYGWWVHAIGPEGWSAASIGRFDVSAVSPVGHELLGSSASVAAFSAANMCSGYDIPDAPARAFRDVSGNINLLAASEINYRAVGTTLGNVVKSCTPIYSSVWDPVYENFQNGEWIIGAYTENGTNVYGLVHNEWYAYFIDPDCPGGAQRGNGWINTLTLVQSTNGGRTFSHTADRIVSRPPFGWSLTDPRYTCTPEQPTRFGSFSPSNIIKVGAYYYAMYQSETDPDRVVPVGACLMRTQNLGVGTAWEKWTAGGWNASPTAICSPIDSPAIEKMHETIVYNTFLNRYVLVGTKYSPTPGTYYSTSSDLFHWSEPVLVHVLNGADHAYPSLLDPSDTTRNFERPGERPFVYWSDLDNGRGLHRQRIRLIGGEAPREIQVPGAAVAARSPGWFLEQRLAYTYGGNNWLEYEVMVPEAGTWQVGVSARQHPVASVPPEYRFSVALSVDGTAQGNFEIIPDRFNDRDGSRNVTLSAGVHRVRYTWLNDYYVPPMYDANIMVTQAFLRR